MEKSCITSVAFREPYITHSMIQEKVFVGINCNFFRDCLPMKGIIYTENIVGEFQKSLYGFKPHAIQRTIDKGYKKIIWLDPAVLPITSIDILINALDQHLVITITGDATMDKMCNERALKYFGITKEEAKNIKHVGGTIYGFNFNQPKAVEVFNLWKQAEEDGIFGSQDDFMQGHWSDEACMALALYKCGVEQYFPIEFKYLNQKEMPTT